MNYSFLYHYNCSKSSSNDYFLGYVVSRKRNSCLLIVLVKKMYKRTYLSIFDHTNVHIVGKTNKYDHNIPLFLLHFTNWENFRAESCIKGAASKVMVSSEAITSFITFAHHTNKHNSLCLLVSVVKLEYFCNYT